MTTAPWILLLATAAAGCGRTEKSKAKQKTEPAFGPVEPIPYQTLVSLLPKLEGWESQPPRGEITRLGEEKLSVARAEYGKTVDTTRLSLSLEVMDGRYGSSAYAPFAALAHSGGSMANPHRMPIKLDGSSGMQEWNPEAKTVRVLLLVARRFVITVRGTNLTPAIVNESLRAIDLKRLASFAEGDPYHRAR